jgi:hypothetical protein
MLSFTFSTARCCYIIIAYSLTTSLLFFYFHFSLDETIETPLLSSAPAGNSNGRDKDTKDSNNNSATTNNEANGRSAALERAYVHDVYENCEEPVGAIRPRVAQFLANLDAGSIVCDVGCGNGRYLTAGCNPSIYSIGVDRCYRLSKIASTSGAEVRSKTI